VWSVLEGFVAAYFNLSLWRTTAVVDLWVALRFGIVVFLLWIGVPWLGSWAAVAAFGLLLEVLLYQAGVVIRGGIPKSSLRLLLLTIASYVTVGLCFAVFYALLGNHFNHQIGRFDSAYFSFVTLGTIGFGDIFPMSSRLLKVIVVAEHLAGLYYLAIVLVVAVDLARKKWNAA